MYSTFSVSGGTIQVYASTPFKLRKGLHKEAAKWISERHRRDFRDRADVMPVLISHLTQAHEEARAQAMLAVLKVRMAVCACMVFLSLFC